MKKHSLSGIKTYHKFAYDVKNEEIFGFENSYQIIPSKNWAAIGNNSKWCTCNKPAENKMVGCDGQNCSIEWFHLKCVNMEQIPEGNWYCSACKSTKKSKKYISITTTN